MNRKKAKHLQSLAWVLAACLVTTSVTPAVTAFAAQEEGQVSSEYKGDDTSASSGSDKQDDGTDSGSAASADHDAAHSTDSDNKTEDDKTDAAANDDKPDAEAEEDKSEDKSENVSSGDESGDDESEDEASEDGSTTEEDIDDAASDEVTADESSDDMTIDEEVTYDKEIDAGEAVDEIQETPEAGVAEDETVKEETEIEEPTDENPEDEELEEEFEEEIEIELLTASPSDIEYVCEIDENGYKSISAALSVVNDGDTITLLKEIKENVIVKGKELTLDLGGFTLRGRVDVEEGADVTLKNGTVYAENSFSTVYASGNDSHPTRLTIADDAIVTADGYGLVICGVTGSKDHNGTGYEVVIDGSVKGIDGDSAGIFLQGNMRNTSAKVCDLTVNGIVEGGNYDGVALAINGWGNVTVNEGAVISATTAIEIRAGSLSVEGGTITGTGKQFADVPNTNGTTASGAGIMINEHTTDLPITVDINGGHISGAYALVQDNTQNNKNHISVTVTGGEFYSVKGNASIRVYSPKDVSLLVYCGRFSSDTLLEDYLADGATLEYEDGMAAVHTYNVIGNIASCTEGAEGIYTCEYCGESKSGASVGALGHVWGEWKVSKEPTAIEDGISVRECSRCGETETKPIPAFGEEDKPEDKPEETGKPDEGNKPSTGNKPSSGRPASSGSHSKGDSGSSSASDNSSAAAADSTQHVISGLNPEGFSGQDSVLSTEPGFKAAPADVTFIDPVTGSTMSGNAPVYTDAGGRSGSFALGGTTFTKPDGTHPVNEYLKIGGQIYAFDASGVAVPFDNMDYYSPAVIASLSGLPEEEGNWDVLGMMFVYSDGTYPVNSWSELAIDGVSQSYYFGPDGMAATGWTMIDGIWHYFNSDGTLMREGTTPDGMKVDINGQITM